MNEKLHLIISICLTSAILSRIDASLTDLLISFGLAKEGNVIILYVMQLIDSTSVFWSTLVVDVILYPSLILLARHFKQIHLYIFLICISAQIFIITVQLMILLKALL